MAQFIYRPMLDPLFATLGLLSFDDNYKWPR